MGVGGIDGAILFGDFDIPGKEALAGHGVGLPCLGGNIETQDRIGLVAVHPHYSALAVNIEGLGQFVYYWQLIVGERLRNGVILHQQ